MYTEKHTVEHVNGLTGEIVKQTTTTRKKDKPRAFIMVFTETISQLLGLMNNEGKFYAMLLSRVDKDCMVTLNAYNKKQIIRECGITDGNLVNRASQLLYRIQKKGLVKKMGGGTWMLNPDIIGKNAHMHRILELKQRFADIIIHCDMENNTRTIEVKSNES